jgi:hypothetical protein
VYDTRSRAGWCMSILYENGGVGLSRRHMHSRILVEHMCLHIFCMLHGAAKWFAKPIADSNLF